MKPTKSMINNDVLLTYLDILKNDWASHLRDSSCDDSIEAIMIHTYNESVVKQIYFAVWEMNSAW